MNMKLEETFEEIKDKLAPVNTETDHAGQFAQNNHEILKNANVFSCLVPSEYGGGGVDYLSLSSFMQKLAKINPSTALSLAMHQHIVATSRYNDAAGRPGKALLEKVAANELILISTGANDWMQSSGELIKVEGGYRLNAVKPFASGAPIGNVVVTSAPFKNDDGEMQVFHFPVPKSSDGVTILEDWDTYGMRETGSNSILFEDVFIPEEAIVAKRPQAGFAPPVHAVLPCALPLIMSVYLGLAEDMAEKAAELCQRQSDDVVTQIKLGQMLNELTTAQIAVEDMLRLNNNLSFEMGMPLSNQMLARKSIASNALQNMAKLAIEVVGGRAFYKKYDLERMMRDLAASEFHPLPKARQEVFAGRLSLGLEPID